MRLVLLVGFMALTLLLGGCMSTLTETTSAHDMAKSAQTTPPLAYQIASAPSPTSSMTIVITNTGNQTETITFPYYPVALGYVITDASGVTLDEQRMGGLCMMTNCDIDSGKSHVIAIGNNALSSASHPASITCTLEFWYHNQIQTKVIHRDL